MKLIKCLLFIILICNLNSFASLSRLRPLAARAINTKMPSKIIPQIKSISDDESQKLNHLQELIKHLDPEFKNLVIEKISENYKNMSQEELAELIKNIQTSEKESIKKSERILSITLPLIIGITSMIPTAIIIAWSNYIIDSILG